MLSSREVHRRCSLGFVEDAMPRDIPNGAGARARQVICPNTAPHAMDQELGLHLLLERNCGPGRSAETMKGQEYGWRSYATHLLEFHHSSGTGWFLTECSRERRRRPDCVEGTAWHEPSKTINASAVRGLRGDIKMDRRRCAVSGWLAHNVDVLGDSGKGGDRFGVAIGKGTGPDCRTLLRLTEILPRIHLWYGGAME